MILILDWIVLTSDNPKNITLRVGIRKDGEHAGYKFILMNYASFCLAIYTILRLIDSPALFFV